MSQRQHRARPLWKVVVGTLHCGVSLLMPSQSNSSGSCSSRASALTRQIFRHGSVLMLPRVQGILYRAFFLPPISDSGACPVRPSHSSDSTTSTPWARVPFWSVEGLRLAVWWLRLDPVAYLCGRFVGFGSLRLRAKPEPSQSCFCYSKLLPLCLWHLEKAADLPAGDRRHKHKRLCPGLCQAQVVRTSPS